MKWNNGGMAKAHENKYNGENIQCKIMAKMCNMALMAVAYQLRINGVIALKSSAIMAKRNVEM